MPFVSVSLDLDGLDPQSVESLLFEYGASSVSYSDQRDDPILEPAPGEFRLWPASRVQALFAGDVDRDALIARLARELAVPAARLQLAAVADRIWEREWLKDFRPMRFGSRLWICPTHATVTASDAIIVQLDPGLAFGTGTHPTTALCLEWLDANAPVAGDVIDYGCGSGVLAIATVKLGAARAQAFDIDPQALLATHDNATRNGVAAAIEICASAEQLRRGAELVIANILAGPLCELAPQLATLTRPQGWLVLSGLLDGQADEVIRAHSRWAALHIAGSRDGWLCLAGRRNATPAMIPVRGDVVQNPPL